MIELREVDTNERTEETVAVLTIPLADVKRLHSALALAAAEWSTLRPERAEQFRGMAHDVSDVFDQLMDDLAVGMLMSSQDA